MPKNTSELYYEHPIFNPLSLHLDTPMMHEIHDEITRWLWTGATGGVIYGAARSGKTTALVNIGKKLRLRSGQLIPSFYLSVPTRDQKTITSVLRHICDSAELPYTKFAVADSLAKMFLHHVIDATEINQCRRVLLIVDEMQRLKTAQFNVFAEMYDELRQLGILLTVIFIGNDPECWNVINALDHKRHAHILGRFFIQVVPYSGIRSEEGVRACLREYDTLKFPEDGPTYTEFFLSEPFAQGYRLTSLSSDLWRVFREYQLEYKLESWGMQYFTTIVNTLLSDMLPTHGCDSFCDEMIHECIKISGLVPSVVGSNYDD